jgi:hypothetical protein
MLACDLIHEVRASRSLSAEQVRRLERIVFSGGTPSADDLEMLLAIDGMVRRAHPSWSKLLARAAAAPISGRIPAGQGAAPGHQPQPS